jgi:hypothetical protein
MAGAERCAPVHGCGPGDLSLSAGVDGLFRPEAGTDSRRLQDRARIRRECEAGRG